MSNYLTFDLTAKILAATESARKEKYSRVKVERLSYGIKFLDECAGGILPSDLIVVGAQSGAGKTQFATNCALANAKDKRVCYYALEAENFEIERRIKYQLFSQLYFGVLREKHLINMNYLDWVTGELNEVFNEHEESINSMFDLMAKGLHVFYNNNGEAFTAETLQKSILAQSENFDLFIIDHLHYFDFDEDNENRAMKSLLKTIRATSLMVGKPILLVSHIRKSDRRFRTLTPDQDDLHGSSDVPKIATRVIMLSKASMVETNHDHVFPTFIRIAKHRLEGSRQWWTGLCSFNAKTTNYEPHYLLSKYQPTKFNSICSEADLPHWAKSAKIGVPLELELK